MCGWVFVVGFVVGFVWLGADPGMPWARLIQTSANGILANGILHCMFDYYFQLLQILLPTLQHL